MPSPDAVNVVCHAERTDDAGVVRWVCSSPPLGADGLRVAPADDPLAGVEMWVLGNAVHVRVGSVAAGAAVVDAAVRAALAVQAGWLCDGGTGAPSLAEVQRLVDQATRSLTEFHGGGLAVVGIEGDTVLLQASGNCHGCRFTDETLRRLAAPAVHRRYPGLRFSVV